MMTRNILKRLEDRLRLGELQLLLIIFQICLVIILFYFCWHNPTKILANGLKAIAITFGLEGFSQRLLLCLIQAIYLSIFPHFFIVAWMLKRVGLKIEDIATAISLLLLLYGCILFLLN